MTNFVVDESVLQASSPTADGPRCSADELQRVLDWLDSFRNAEGERVAIDEGFALWAAYALLGETNYGLLVLQEKLERGALRTTPIPEAVDGRAMITGEWGHLDEHRRRVLLVAQHRPVEITVANATHEDWHASRCPTGTGAVTVHQILGPWLDAQIAAAQAGALDDSVRAYVAPPHQLDGALATAASVGVGINGRKAWEDGNRRYEWDYQHGTVEVYALGSGKWLHEAQTDGTTTKQTGGKGRRWGKP